MPKLLGGKLPRPPTVLFLVLTCYACYLLCQHVYIICEWLVKPFGVFSSRHFPYMYISNNVVFVLVLLSAVGKTTLFHHCQATVDGIRSFRSINTSLHTNHIFLLTSWDQYIARSFFSCLNITVALHRMTFCVCTLVLLINILVCMCMLFYLGKERWSDKW